MFKDEEIAILMRKFVKDFKIHLNQIKINRESPSDNFLHFSVFRDQAWFEVFYGFEEVTATLKNPKDEKQVMELYSKLADCFNPYPMNRQLINIQQQLGTEGDAAGYLMSLNPNPPEGFKKLLTGTGVFYTLKVPGDELLIHISVAASLFIPGGIFFSVENDFNPNKHNFADAVRIVKKHREEILNNLEIEIQQVT